MRWLVLCLALFAARMPAPAAAQDRAGDFDYYVLSLSWSPAWCTLEGDARDAEQCDEALDFGFILHGLWPQYERGWPQDCPTDARDPSRAETGAMADIMGSGGLAWYQWQKHGRCSGLEPDDYFALSREAFSRVVRPETLRDGGRLSPRAVEEAFLDANPALAADGLTVTCKAEMLQEVRICLGRDLEPRRCGADVLNDCRSASIQVPAVR